ncbi:hypothetical protein [Paraburkholderia tuberum]|uniref:hypothetical protein n=1 Tax=Paraburkholderia tuberum TaxID=157910 RepID=UPI00115F9922|nr:hypothetical protein [Paraburkholderia tuberum]
MQHQRLALLAMRELVDEAVRQARAVDRDLVVGDCPLMQLRVRLAREILRVGGEQEIDDRRLDRSRRRCASNYGRDSAAKVVETEGRRHRRLRSA